MKINALYESVTNTITKEMETDGAPWAKRTPKVLSPLLLGEEANHYTRFCEKYERGQSVRNRSFCELPLTGGWYHGPMNVRFAPEAVIPRISANRFSGWQRNYAPNRRIFTYVRPCRSDLTRDLL